MTPVERTLEMGGMARSEIVDYFSGIGGELISEGKYQGPDWIVDIGKEEYRAVGSIRLRKTYVTFYCDEKYIDTMIYKFRLKFLSAGG